MQRPRLNRYPSSRLMPPHTPERARLRGRPARAALPAAGAGGTAMWCGEGRGMGSPQGGRGAGAVCHHAAGRARKRLQTQLQRRHGGTPPRRAAWRSWPIQCWQTLGREAAWRGRPARGSCSASSPLSASSHTCRWGVGQQQGGPRRRRGVSVRRCLALQRPPLPPPHPRLPGQNEVADVIGAIAQVGNSEATTRRLCLSQGAGAAAAPGQAPADDDAALASAILNAYEAKLYSAQVRPRACCRRGAAGACGAEPCEWSHSRNAPLMPHPPHSWSCAKHSQASTRCVRAGTCVSPCGCGLGQGGEWALVQP